MSDGLAQEAPDERLVFTTRGVVTVHARRAVARGWVAEVVGHEVHAVGRTSSEAVLNAVRAYEDAPR